MNCNGIETYGGKGCYIASETGCRFRSETGCKLRVDIYGNFHHADHLTGNEIF